MNTIRNNVFLCAAIASMGGTIDARADVALLQPQRTADAHQPLALTVLYSAPPDAPFDVAVPPTLDVIVSTQDVPPRHVTLHAARGTPARLRLKRGAMRMVRYAGEWPDMLRGVVRVEPVGFDTSPMLITLNLTAEPQVAGGAPTTGATSASPSDMTSARAPAASSPTASDARASNAASGVGTRAEASQPGATPADSNPLRYVENRLSFYEPIYFAAGKNGDQDAKFQLSFKYRIFMPDDLRSRAFFDNLYFAYTQRSLWDLSEESKPFKDTSYMPSVFYYLPDIGLRSRFFSAMGIAAGVGHESNGQAGGASRSINIAFVQPTWAFGNVNDTHLSVSPKLYYYLQKSENPDIAKYRGYMDLLVKYGSPNGLQLATTLRKGTHAWYGSVETQLTYPLARLLGGGWGGYLFAAFFDGYGEDIRDYNKRNHWSARIGYSISR